MKTQAATVITRPRAVVFDFVGTNHVRNHPRWDPTIQLQQVTAGPIGLGTVIRRETSRGDGPAMGTMEIVEWEPDRAIGTVIHDGPLEMLGRMVIEPVDHHTSTLTIHLNIPSMSERIDPGPIERSLTNIKELIETGA